MEGRQRLQDAYGAAQPGGVGHAHEKTCAKLETYKAHIGPIDYRPRRLRTCWKRARPAHGFRVPADLQGRVRKLEALPSHGRMDAPGLPGNDRQSLELFEAIARFDSYYVVLEKDLPKCTRSSASLRRCFPGRGRTTYIVAKQAKRS